MSTLLSDNASRIGRMFYATLGAVLILKFIVHNRFASSPAGENTLETTQRPAGILEAFINS